MGLRTTLTRLITAPAAARVEARVRALVDAAIEARDYAEPAAIRAAATHLAHARTALDELSADLAQSADAIDALSLPSPAPTSSRSAGLDAGPIEALEEALNDAARAAVHRKDELEVDSARVGAVARLAGQAHDAAAITATSFAALDASSKPAPSTARACKVEGCDGSHRARGFCGKHYQLWKRGVLPGFVLADGPVILEADGTRHIADAAQAGQPAALIDGALTVG